MANYIKIMRELKEKSFYCRDSEKVHLWVHLLLSANWIEREEVLGGKPIVCKSGQFTTGRKQLSMQTGISESKIERILTYFEKIEQQIEQQKTSTNRLISILNWDKYQYVEQRNEQQVNSDRTAGEQRVNTLKEYKEVKNKIKKEYGKEILDLVSEISCQFDGQYMTDKVSATFQILTNRGYSIDDIRNAICKGKNDPFWNKQFQSPNKLNLKDKSDVYYIDKFLALNDSHRNTIPFNSESMKGAIVSSGAVDLSNFGRSK